MNTKHTPGPWTAELAEANGAKKRFIRDSTRLAGAERCSSVCRVTPRGKSTAANMLLIAAAPELLEACTEAECEIDTLLSHPVPTDALAARRGYLRELMDILRAAIARAERGQE